MNKLIRKFIAMLRFTFVADCPRCHKHFYGFHSHICNIRLEKHYRIVCHRCTADYNALNSTKANKPEPIRSPNV